MSRIVEETPYTAKPAATGTHNYSGWFSQHELHWCEGCGLLLKNGALIIHPPGTDNKALWFCNSACQKKFEAKGPYYTIYPFDECYE